MKQESGGMTESESEKREVSERARERDERTTEKRKGRTGKWETDKITEARTRMVSNGNISVVAWLNTALHTLR